MTVSIDQQFIEYIVKTLVGNPDDVKIERRIDEKGVLLELSVNPDDLGRVIGKRGATAQSIRTLLRALGTKNDARYNLKIVDTGPPPAKRTSATDNADDNQSDDPKSTAADDQTVTEEIEKPRNDENSKSEETKGLDVSEAEDEEIPSEPPKEETPPKEEEKEDMITRTRRELADLDDLEL